LCRGNSRESIFKRKIKRYDIDTSLPHREDSIRVSVQPAATRLESFANGRPFDTVDDLERRRDAPVIYISLNGDELSQLQTKTCYLLAPPRLEGDANLSRFARYYANLNAAAVNGAIAQLSESDPPPRRNKIHHGEIAFRYQPRISLRPLFSSFGTTRRDERFYAEERASRRDAVTRSTELIIQRVEYPNARIQMQAHSDARHDYARAYASVDALKY